ncbi:hypothetical protein [Paraburkholderia youngii]|uniref:hypothetical protein n=1 Tax=Paraburkholderia youngii TaxID=2782701 RepID=UPI003D1ADF88
MNRYRPAVCALCLCVVPATYAQEDTRTLTREEVLSLIPGTTITARNAANGSTRTWTNRADGKFYVEWLDSWNRLYVAPGEWHISDKGRYCVVIGWVHAIPETWCRGVTVDSEGHYALSNSHRAFDPYAISR